MHGLEVGGISSFLAAGFAGYRANLVSTAMTTEQRRNIFIDQGTDFYQEFEYPDAQAGDLATAQLFRWFGGPLMATFSATVNIVGKTVEIALAGVDTAKIKRSGEYNIIIQNGSSTETLFVGKAALRVGSAPASSTSPPYPIGQYSATKDAARLVATSNITLGGLSTIDGVAVNQNDRVLVVGQTDKTKNGLYSAASGTWRRSGDADTSAEMVPGFAIWVAEGTWNGDSLWELTTDAPIVLGTTELVFTSELGKPAGLASSVALAAEVDRAEAAEAGKQPLDPDLTTIASLNSAQPGVIASEGEGWYRKSLGSAATHEATDFDVAGAATTAQAAAEAYTDSIAVTTKGGGGDHVVTATATGPTYALNLSAANVFDITLAADVSFSATGAIPARADSFTLLLRQDSAGGHLPTFPGMVFPDGTPSWSTVPLSVATVTFLSLDGGTTWYGFPGSLANQFNIVGPKNSGYTAKVGEIVKLDASGGSFSCSLPQGAQLGDTVGYKLMGAGINGAQVGNTVTLNVQGTDTINNGTASVLLKLKDEVITFISDGAGNWLVGPGHKSYSSLQAVFAPIDSVPTAYQTYVMGLVVTNSNLAALALESGYVWAVTDQNGRVAWGILPDGTVTGKIAIADGSLTAQKLSSDVLARLPLGSIGQDLQSLPGENPTYAYAIVDSTGRIAFAVAADGTLVGKLAPPDGSITAAKLAPAAASMLMQSMGVESGYAWAVVDQTGRVALGIASDGTLSGKMPPPQDHAITYAKLAGDVTPLLLQTTPVESGYAWAIVDQAGRVALGVDRTGKLVGNTGIVTTDRSGTVAANDDYLIEPFMDNAGHYQLRSHRRSDGLGTVLTTVGDNYDPRLTSDDKVLYRSEVSGNVKQVYRPAAGGAAYPVIPLLADGVAFWGDSLTAAGGMSSSIESTVQSALNCPVSNYGIGSQTSVQIAARQGGAPALLTLAGNAIPTSGGVAVTSISTPICYHSGLNDGTIDGTLAGIHGTLSSDTSSNYTFTRTTSGSGVSCPANTPFISDNGVNAQGQVQVLWLGRNNFAQSSQVQSDTAACVSYIKSYLKRVIVLSVLNGAGEASGSSAYTQITTLNNSLATAYGSHYIDVRSYLVQHGLTDAGLTPTTQDLADIANDIVPTQLRIDSIHLTNAGYTVVGTQIANKITSLGWS